MSAPKNPLEAPVLRCLNLLNAARDRRGRWVDPYDTSRAVYIETDAELASFFDDVLDGFEGKWPRKCEVEGR